MNQRAMILALVRASSLKNIFLGAVEWETIPFVPHDKFLRNVIVTAEPIKTEFFWLYSISIIFWVTSGAITLLFKLK